MGDFPYAHTMEKHREGEEAPADPVDDNADLFAGHELQIVPASGAAPAERRTAHLSQRGEVPASASQDKLARELRILRGEPATAPPGSRSRA